MVNYHSVSSTETITATQSMIITSTKTISAQDLSPDSLVYYKTLPVGIPKIEVTTLITNEVSDGYIFIAPYPRQQSHTAPYIMIVDNNGALIYYKFLTAHANDFKKQPTGDLTYFVYANRTQYVMDTAYTVTEEIKTKNGYQTDMHDFLMLPNGNVMLLAYEEKRVDMSQIVEGGYPDAVVFGCRIQELNPDREVIFEWSGFDHYEFTDSYDDLTTETIDYIHCNSIEIDTDDNILLSSRDFNEITKINHKTGEIMWRLGGKNNQFEFINAIGAEDLEFVRQHDARRAPNGNITLFDNRTFVSTYSRAVEYEVDEINMTAKLVWEYRNDPDIYTMGLANTQRLTNGNTIIGWGHSRTYAVTEVKQDGTKLFELSIPREMQNYRAFRFPWSGKPNSEPALHVMTSTQAITLTYSWNGATDVVAYKVYGDKNDPPTTLITTQPKTGFETQTVITNMLNGPYNFRVEAIFENNDSNNDSQYNYLPMITK